MSKWDGVPLNPDRHGWHWVQESDLDPECAFWRSQPYMGNKRGRWETNGTQDFFEPYEVSTWRYLGPVATQEETAAQAARIAELEAALNKINDKDSYPNGGFGPFAEIARAALEGGEDE